MNAAEAGEQIALKHILFATDSSPCSDTALPCAVSLARKYGATLHAAHVIPTVAADIVFMSPEDWPTRADEIELQAEQQFTSLEASLKGIRHRLLSRKGKVSEALNEVVTGSEIDLVVLGTHGRRGVRKLVMGSIAEEILRRARCSILSVGPHVSHNPDHEAEFRHILFATDFSPESLAEPTPSL